MLSPDSAGSLDAIGWNGYLTAAQAIAAQVMGNTTSKAKFMTCDPTTNTTTCLTNTVQTFGRTGESFFVSDGQKGFQLVNIHKPP